MGLFISYWRSNFTRTVRIMRDAADPASVVGTVRLAGAEVSEQDVRKAEKLKAALELKEAA